KTFGSFGLAEAGAASPRSAKAQMVGAAMSRRVDSDIDLSLPPLLLLRVAQHRATAAARSDYGQKSMVAATVFITAELGRYGCFRPPRRGIGGRGSSSG